MTLERFDFQARCVRSALDHLSGVALNVGCNTDPGHLKDLDPERVINCDLYAEDNGLPTGADVLFDCARDHWPFKYDEASIVVFGDILEHLTPTDILAALKEARRVSKRVCITVPEDWREEVGAAHLAQYPRGLTHLTTVTQGLLANLLKRSGWTVLQWLRVCYDDGTFWGQRTDGHFVLAH